MKHRRLYTSSFHYTFRSWRHYKDRKVFLPIISKRGYKNTTDYNNDEIAEKFETHNYEIIFAEENTHMTDGGSRSKDKLWISYWSSLSKLIAEQWLNWKKKQTENREVWREMISHVQKLYGVYEWRIRNWNLTSSALLSVRSKSYSNSIFYCILFRNCLIWARHFLLYFWVIYVDLEHTFEVQSTCYAITFILIIFHINTGTSK